MRAAHGPAAVEIAERPGELQHPMIASRGQPHAFGGVAQQAERGGVGFGDLLHRARRRRRISGDAIETQRAIALDLDRARRRDAFGDLGRAFARRRLQKVGGGDRRNVDRQIEAVEQRP